MQGEQYLKKPEQYAAVYDNGTSWVNRMVVLKALPNGSGLSRFGISVSSRVGGAVVRNQVKRRIREILRQTQLVSGWDIVLIVRPPAAKVDYTILEKSVGDLLLRGKLVSERTQPQETV